MTHRALALVASLALAAGAAGCATEGGVGRSGAADSTERTPRPEGAALGVGPWTLTGKVPPNTQLPALGAGAPSPPSPAR